LQCDEAAQLMPPPRLPRHLRPCQPSGTAKQARRSYTTARIKSSTAGDDAPQSSNAKSNDAGSDSPHDASDRNTDAATGKSSWWGAAMASIASLGLKTTSTRANAQTPDTPATSTPRDTEEKKGAPPDNGQDISSVPIRKTNKNAVQRLRQKERLAARLQQVSEDSTEKEGRSPLPIRRLVTNVDTRRIRAEEERQLSTTSSETKQIPGPPSFIRQENAMGRERLAIQKDDTMSLQQQLQLLFEQVRNLQATLDGRLAAEQPSPTPAAGKATSTAKSAMFADIEQQPGSEVLPFIRKVPDPEPFPSISTPVAAATTEFQASHEVTVNRSGKKPRAPRSTNRMYVQTYREARSAYRNSINQLGKTAEVLGELPPLAVAPIASSILQRLHALEHERETKLDREIINIAKRYRHVLKSLADGLARLPIAHHAQPEFINSGTTATSRSTDNSGNMVFTLLPGYRTDRSLQACGKGYQASTRALVDVANTLESMQSPAVSPILTQIRNRLREIAEHAKLEKDSDIARILGRYSHWKLLYAEDKYSPTVIKQPAAVLRLNVADVRRKLNEVMEDKRSLSKEISLITPSSPRMRINKELIIKAKSAAFNTRVPGVEVLRSDKMHSRTRVRAADAANVPESKSQHIGAKRTNRQASEQAIDAAKGTDSVDAYIADKKSDGQRLTRQIHTQSRSMKSSDHLNINTQDGDHQTTKAKKFSESKTKTPSKTSSGATGPSTTAANILASAPRDDELSEQSLLEELFPEATSTPQPRYSEKRDQYPKLELPDSTPIIRRELVDGPRTPKEQVVDSFQSKSEQITVLQLTNCSTELAEADFQRLIPKGKHIEAWRRDGDFYKIIPGRDPLSLERMPFYYILFKGAEAALAYQKNASRLHKLSALHQPANIFSAIPPPKGFLEDGEDITAAIQSYNLLPTHHPLSLNVLMQPYNPALRALIERGGYQPIAPSISADGTRIWKVLLHIEGYEPTPSDLFKIMNRDAYKQGMTLPLRNESHSSIHRLRDTINLKTSVKPISSASPRAYGTFEHNNTAVNETTYADPAIQSMLQGAEEDNANALNQLVMNRVYNRWVLDFEDEDSARRWCLSWHRRVLPELSHGKGSWREGEEVRVCNTEILW
jgi:hypothetical protein